MKIIAKVKDYYDYLMGIRGVDPLYVYDRTDFNLIDDSKSDRLFYIAFCDNLYPVVRKKDKYYIAEQIKEVVTKPKDRFYEQNEYKLILNKGYGRDKMKINIMSSFTDLNVKYNCPVILYNDRVKDISINPLLREIGWPSFMSAEQAYQSIYNWLAKQKTDHENQMTANNLSDIEKLKNNGFDEVISFRHRK